VILLHGPSSRSCAEILANSINAKKAGIAVLAQVDFSALCLDSPPGEYYYPQKKQQRVPNAMEEEDNEQDNGPEKHGECANYVLDETLRMFGRVDILVHADDVCRKGSLVDIDEAFFDQMIRANVKEPLFLTKFVAPYMNEGMYSSLHC
jgi:NAD(P)-dependent dehydrogenase (short-subunit alcohol dehydrogenase family)